MEIGIGHGGFYGYFEGIKNYLGLDIDSKLIEECRLKNPSAEYIEFDIASKGFLEELGSRRFDSVLCVNVLEHIPEESQALENMLNVIQPGGFLLLFVPAFEGLYTDMDRLAGHERRYTFESLQKSIPMDQCVIEKMEYFNPIGGVGWWANRFASHKNLDSSSINSQIIFFDKWILPVSRAINFFTRSFFGQSIVCVLRKKQA